MDIANLMDERWRQRLADRMTALGITPAELTRTAGVNATMVHDILKRGATPSVANLAKLASAMGMRLVELLSDDSNSSQSIRLSGVLQGGDMWKELGGDDPGIPLEFFQSEMVSVEIRTSDLEPAYRAGDVVCGPKSVGVHIDNLIGRDCIVAMTSGERYVRTLKRSKTAGRFTLRGLHRNADDIENAQVLWAAPIRMIIRL